MESPEIKAAAESLRNLTVGMDVTVAHMEHIAVLLTELEILQDMGSLSGDDSRQVKAKLEAAQKTISDKDATIKDLTARMKEMESNQAQPQAQEAPAAAVAAAPSKFDGLDLPDKCNEIMQELYDLNDFILATDIKATSDCSPDERTRFLVKLYDKKLAVSIYPPTEDDSEPVAKVKISLDGIDYVKEQL